MCELGLGLVNIQWCIHMHSKLVTIIAAVMLPLPVLPWIHLGDTVMVDGQSRSGNAYRKGKNETFLFQTLWPSFFLLSWEQFFSGGARVL